MSKLSNALRMIELLHARKKMKISELAAELEVKERMIRNYRDELALAGIFVESDKGRDGGYYISNTSFFPVRNMSHKELEALVFSATQLTEKASVYAKYAESALDKLKAVQKLERDKERHIYFVHKSKPNYETSDESSKYLQLQDALLTLRKVKITYTSHSGESERIIEPYGFVHYNEFFYCVAYCNTKKDTRIFKLARIRDIWVTGDSYAIPDNFDVRKEFPKFGLMKEYLDVKLYIAEPFATMVQESVWAENQVITKQEDGILFEATMNGKESVKKWILGMGAKVKVLEPASLRKEIIEEGRKLLEIYEM
ncbi:WYL domain-containing transcriptional regulator [Ectobacillus antri]|jgi:predicted DNA-binding transcriptional regulator YafY|uniref:WYL domain-containing transcriptional regulator n=1 Tax=Ectobacillus antri TaxID=2486280 RepID=A0ABT6H5Y2_9BACI|nr:MULTISPECIES: transcriptional regulator [Ectobacillus]MDG4657538.1 WYL domain-containing transcriptional regulator [Ectobacillus antri]MDG5753851.1 WYL domain-containing transcriptional regulator [Ectobacillus antri]UOY92555.1 transcriptional regulator [Ectobacillus sp. JY-23]